MNTIITSDTPQHITNMSNPFARGVMLGGKRIEHWLVKNLTIESDLVKPLKWKKPRRIFVCAHGDLFHENVPDGWMWTVFGAMALTWDATSIDENCVGKDYRQRHTYQILTKRPDRMRSFMQKMHSFEGDIFKHPLCLYAQQVSKFAGDPFWMNAVFNAAGWLRAGLPGLWLGVSVEDQTRADERIPILLDTPAAVRFISAEPLLGPIDLDTAWHGEDALDPECWGDCGWCKKGYPPLHDCRKGMQTNEEFLKGRSGLDWVIVGGESGPGARPMHPDWARDLRDQCNAAGVPFFFKQMSKKASIPNDLMVREWPCQTL